MAGLKRLPIHCQERLFRTDCQQEASNTQLSNNQGNSWLTVIELSLRAMFWAEYFRHIIPLNPPEKFWEKNDDCAHFTEEKIEVQRGPLNCPGHTARKYWSQVCKLVFAWLQRFYSSPVHYLERQTSFGYGCGPDSMH